MATKTILPGICRFDIDDKKTHGYMVRIMRQGKMRQEFFSDKRCGGKRKAKKAAVERLAELDAELPGHVALKGQMTSRNTSGKVGVHVAHDVDQRCPGSDYWSYVASWVNDDKKRINVKFSWNKYDESVAWKLALIARENELRDREEILAIYEQNKRKAKAKRRRRK